MIKKSILISAYLLVVQIILPQNYSLLFDNYDYVNVPNVNNLNFTNAFSVEFWTKPNNNQNNYVTYVSKMNGWNVGAWAVHSIDNGERIRWEIYTNNGVSNYDSYSIIADDNWHHVVCTWDGNTMRVFIDGILDILGARDGDLVNTSYPVRIGRRQDGQNSVEGLIDDVRIWNYPLSQEEVLSNMYAVLDGSEGGLEAAWNFNENSGTTVYDLTDNNIDGTIIGAAWHDDSPLLDPIYFALDSVFVLSGDIANVGLHIEGLQDIDVVGLEFEINTNIDSIQIVDLALSSEVENWTYELNQIGQVAHIAIAGFDPVESSGLLCELSFLVANETPTAYYPLEFMSVTINTGEYEYIPNNGILNVVHNYPPSTFDLLSPANGDSSIIDSDNIGTSLIVSWDTAFDDDGDEILYLISSNSEELNYLFSQPIDNTVLYIPYQTIYDTFFNYGINRLSFEWNVGAMDEYDTTWATNGPWQYTIDVSQLSLQDEILPSYYILSQNFPNPFNPTTSIQYTIPENSIVKLTIFNIQGKEINQIFNKEHKPGQYAILWDGKDNNGNIVPTGMYFYQLFTKNYSSIRKMIFIK